MLIAVISDSHDHAAHLRSVVSIANGSGCAALFHLGDITTPGSARILEGFSGQVRAVYGNCDRQRESLHRIFRAMGGRIDPPPVTFEMDNRRFALMHEPGPLESLRTNGDLDFILFGHLHDEFLSRERGTLVLNPGECAGGRPSPACYFLDTQSMDATRVPI